MPPFVEITTTTPAAAQPPGPRASTTPRTLDDHARARPPRHHPDPHPPRPRRHPARARGRARGERGARPQARSPPQTLADPARPGLGREAGLASSPPRPGAASSARFLKAVLTSGLPRPVTHHRDRPLRPSTSSGPPHRLVVETDGAALPRPPPSRGDATRRKTPTLQLLGYIVLRIPEARAPRRARARRRARSAVQRRVQRLDAREDLVRDGLLLVARRVRRPRPSWIASP